MARRITRWLGIAAAAVAAKLVLESIDWAALGDALATTGPWFAVLALIDVLAIACDAAAIWSIGRAHAPLTYTRAFAAQTTGYAINRITPAGALGEPIKVGVLAGEIPHAAAVSTIVSYNVVTLAVGAATVTLGVPIALRAIDMSADLRWAIAITAALLVGGVALLVAVLRRGLVARAFRRWPRIVAIGDQLATFGGPATRRALGFATLSRGLHSLGTLIAAHALGVPLTGATVSAVVAFGVVIGWLSNLSPLGLGIADGGSYALYGAFGAAPEIGLAMATIQRARALSVIALGLCLAGARSILSVRIVPRGAEP